MTTIEFIAWAVAFSFWLPLLIWLIVSSGVYAFYLAKTRVLKRCQEISNGHE